MIKLLVTPFVIKLYAWKNIFKQIKKKDGHDLINLVIDSNEENKAWKIGCSHCVYKIMQKRTTYCSIR